MSEANDSNSDPKPNRGSPPEGLGESGAENSTQESSCGTSSGTSSGGPCNGGRNSDGTQDCQLSSGSDSDVEKDKETRKIRRVMANRRSARESRERRKRLLNDLQASVERLSTENEHLALANVTIREEIVKLLERIGIPASLPSLSVSESAIRKLLDARTQRR